MGSPGRRGLAGVRGVAPRASTAASSTSSVKVMAAAACTTHGPSPVSTSTSMYCGSSVV